MKRPVLRRCVGCMESKEKKDLVRIVAGEDGSTIAFELTQAETLRFKAGDAEVQLKCINSEGNVDASGIGRLAIDRALLEREISYADDTD